MHADALVDTYLERLEAEAAGLPSDRRADLVTEVRAHIATAIATAGHRDEATIRTILDRLGEPTEIVAADADASDEPLGEGLAAPGRPIDRRQSWGATEIVAVLLMTAGAVLLPIVGPLIGLVLAWQSARWSRRAKVILSVVVLTIFVVVPVVGFGAWMPAAMGPAPAP